MAEGARPPSAGGKASRLDYGTRQATFTCRIISGPSHPRIRVSIHDNAGRIHDVTGEFVREMAGVGLTNIPFQTLVAMQIHDVSAGFVRGVQETGYAPTIDQLVALRIHDVTPAFIREVVSRKGMVPLQEIIRERIHEDEDE